MRGQIFDIEDKLFFVFGGVHSHDISAGILEFDDPDFKEKKKKLDKNLFVPYRINHVSWWKENCQAIGKWKNTQSIYIITHANGLRFRFISKRQADRLSTGNQADSWKR